VSLAGSSNSRMVIRREFFGWVNLKFLNLTHNPNASLPGSLEMSLQVREYLAFLALETWAMQNLYAPIRLRSAPPFNLPFWSRRRVLPIAVRYAPDRMRSNRRLTSFR
jgi:hypothetical protein